MSTNSMIKEAAKIFDSIEKWEALFEIHTQTGQIINHWLEIGGKAIRNSYSINPSAGWECTKWGGGEKDTRWHFREFGPESVGIGFGWHWWEFTLHLDDSPRFDRAKALATLNTKKFLPLLAAFDYQPTLLGQMGEGRLARNLTFNPYSGNTDLNGRPRELAWYAAHETEEFVNRMLAMVRQITDSSELTTLFRELNFECQLFPENTNDI